MDFTITGHVTQIFGFLHDKPIKVIDILKGRVVQTWIEFEFRYERLKSKFSLTVFVSSFDDWILLKD